MQPVISTTVTRTNYEKIIEWHWLSGKEKPAKASTSYVTAVAGISAVAAGATSKPKPVEKGESFGGIQVMWAASDSIIRKSKHSINWEVLDSTRIVYPDMLSLSLKYMCGVTLQKTIGVNQYFYKHDRW